jgi:hypothetical protein
VEDAAQVRGADARGIARQVRFSQVKSISSARRSARQRALSSAGRHAGVAQALRQLEREHVALLLAVCELEDETSQTPAMREALLVLLRDDLAHAQHALTLAADGRYGICESCLRPLAHRALLLSPATTRCPVCETEQPRTMQA